MEKPPVIFLMGPTASGKTDLAINLHQQFPVDIISVDSALVYRDMNIGTAKPTSKELALAPHRLIDICDPDTAYSAADFCEDAHREIETIHAAGRIPLLAGGTMMYFKALFDGLADMPATDPKVREQIEIEAAEKGWPWMHEQLMAVDPEYASQIHPNHSQRISRALEVFRQSGETVTALRQRQEKTKALSQKYRVFPLALWPEDRQWLHDRIALRFKLMLQNGFIDEVKLLKNKYSLHADLPSMRAVGYRQAWDFLEKYEDNSEQGLKELEEKGIAATRQLARRQLTWIRNWDGVEKVAVGKDLEESASKKIIQLLLNILSD